MCVLPRATGRLCVYCLGLQAGYVCKWIHPAKDKSITMQTSIIIIIHVGWRTWDKFEATVATVYMYHMAILQRDKLNV